MSSKASILLAHKVLIIILTIGTASAATVTGLTIAPGSPGFPYLSPTYQAQKASFQVLNSTDASLSEVWYVPGSTTLILILSASSPQTHFFGFFTGGVNMPAGNFSTQVAVNNERTYLAIPANSCPSLSQMPSAGYTVTIAVLADSPALGGIAFQYSCLANPTLATLTLGNPHVIVASIIPWSPGTISPITGKEGLLLENYVVNSPTNVTLDIRNIGTESVTFVSYYVNDSIGDRYFRNNWSTGPNPPPVQIYVNALGQVNILIGTSGTGTCGSSCSLSGSPFTFQTNYPYRIVLITARNTQFSFQIT